MLSVAIYIKLQIEFSYILQVQNLTLRSQKLGVLSSPQNGSPKSNSQAQTLAVCANKPVTSTKASQSDPVESKRKGDSPTAEPQSPAVTRTSNIHQLIAPGRMESSPFKKWVVLNTRYSLIFSQYFRYVLSNWAHAVLLGTCHKTLNLKSLQSTNRTYCTTIQYRMSHDLNKKTLFQYLLES